MKEEKRRIQIGWQETDLDILLQEESRKKMDVAGCKDADALLKAVFAPDPNLIPDEDLDLIAAASGNSRPRVLLEPPGDSK